MELADSYVTLTEAFLQWSGMTHPLAHLHLGLVIYVGVQLLLRTRRASSIALQAVYGAELINEIIERAHYGSWRIGDTAGDIFMTVFWPTLLYGVAKFRRARWEVRMAKRQLRKERQSVALAYSLRGENVRAPQMFASVD